MAKIPGKNFVVYIDGAKLGDCKDCSITLNQNLIPTTSKDDSNWTTRLAGERDWQVTVDALWDETNSFDLVDAANLIINATEVTVEFTTATASETAFYGQAFLQTQTINAAMGDATGGGLTFVGDGALATYVIPSS